MTWEFSWNRLRQAATVGADIHDHETDETTSYPASKEPPDKEEMTVPAPWTNTAAEEAPEDPQIAEVVEQVLQTSRESIAAPDPGASTALVTRSRDLQRTLPSVLQVMVPLYIHNQPWHVTGRLSDAQVLSVSTSFSDLIKRVLAVAGQSLSVKKFESGRLRDLKTHTGQYQGIYPISMPDVQRQVDKLVVVLWQGTVAREPSDLSADKMIVQLVLNEQVKRYIQTVCVWLYSSLLNLFDDASTPDPLTYANHFLEYEKQNQSSLHTRLLGPVMPFAEKRLLLMPQHAQRPLLQLTNAGGTPDSSSQPKQPTAREQGVAPPHPAPAFASDPYAIPGLSQLRNHKDTLAMLAWAQKTYKGMNSQYPRTKVTSPVYVQLDQYMGPLLDMLVPLLIYNTPRDSQWGGHHFLRNQPADMTRDYQKKIATEIQLRLLSYMKLAIGSTTMALFEGNTMKGFSQYVQDMCMVFKLENTNNQSEVSQLTDIVIRNTRISLKSAVSVPELCLQIILKEQRKLYMRNILESLHEIGSLSEIDAFLKQLLVYEQAPSEPLQQRLLMPFMSTLSMAQRSMIPISNTPMMPSPDTQKDDFNAKRDSLQPPADNRSQTLPSSKRDSLQPPADNRSQTLPSSKRDSLQPPADNRSQTLPSSPAAVPPSPQCEERSPAEQRGHERRKLKDIRDIEVSPRPQPAPAAHSSPAYCRQ